MSDRSRNRVLEKITTWLEEEGRGDSLVNQRWEVSPVQDSDILVATSKGLPFSIGIEITKHFVNLVLYTGIETAVMPNTERLKLYRDLLLLNNQNQMMKFLLAGMEEVVGIRVDLNRLTLGKTEFNDALSSLIIGAEALKAILARRGAGDEDKEALEKIAQLIAAELEAGKSRKTLIRDLVSAGMTKEEATHFVNDIAERLNLEARDRYIS